MPVPSLSRVVRGLLTLAGLAAAGAAVFAVRLGLDTNTDWGPSRKFLLAFGLLLAFAGWTPDLIAWIWRRAVSSGWGRAVGNGLGRAWEAVARHPAAEAARGWTHRAARRTSAWFERAPVFGWLLAKPGRAALAACLLVWALGVTSYLWIGTVGTWTDWPPTTADFDLLARGFLRGQLSLPVQPPPQLQAMSDPYIMASRQYLPNLWDVSYFQGHFYLYWGPVPGVILAAVKAVTPIRIDDGWLTFVFAGALSLMGVLCVRSLWARWPVSLPWWTVGPPAVAMLWAAPVVWLLSRGAVYEVAIASGQFFLLAGLLLALPSFWGEALSAGRLAAASACLALAIGCRVNLGPACILILAVPAWRSLLAHRRQPSMMASHLAAGGLPMLAAGALLGGYNLARFGSFLEFGHRYQLGRWDKYHDYGAVFGLDHAIPNLYNYFLNGVHTLSVFPYLKPAWGQYYIWVTHTYAPDLYHTEQVAGVLIAVPFVWLAAAALAHWGAGLGKLTSGPGRWAHLRSFFVGTKGVECLLGAVVILLVSPLASFISVSMRHEVDFVPTLVLLAAMGFWLGYQRLTRRTAARWAWSMLVLGLALGTALVGVLLAFTGFQGNFETYNPDLFQQLTRIFSP